MRSRSRIIVKNLPHYLSDAQLREHFSTKGVVTDARLAHRKDGTSRRFGFVGFKSEADARAAVEYFNKTYIDSSRIAVELAETDKAAAVDQHVRKRRKLSPDHEKPDVPAPKAAKQNKDLEEFMSVMAKKPKGRAWNDSDSVNNQNTKDVKKKSQPDNQTSGDMTDLDWMKSHMTKSIRDVDDENDAINSEKEQEAEDEPPQENPSDAKDAILATGRLFLRNLAFATKEDDLQERFSSFGELTQVHIPVDAATNQPKGLAFVTFNDARDAVTAFEQMDGRDFQGRLLHIMPAIDRRPKDSQKLTTVKGATLKQRKADAGKDFNWSMLYMNSDAVASSIAHKLKISKSDILDSSSDTINPAVKLALAETHIIAETKKYLEENGVVLESFSKPARSPTTILVKNIPFGTTQEALLALFEPYGELNRILIPPAGTIAVVDFMQEKDANAAFRGVAYRRMKNSIIYLEKAPLGVFINDKTKPLNPIASSSNTHAVAIADPLRAVEQTTESSDAAAGSTLFVKNLNFGTTSDGLTRAFRGLTGFVFARVQTKPDPKNTGGKLSMGYGFVGFRHADDAKKAIGTMNGFVLDGHSLVVKFSGRGADPKEGEPSTGLAAKTKTTKMIVKNVPFEASKKDIRDLFSAHGQIKSIRMPRKFDAKTRGFAFLEFVSRRDAENALEALKHTHLLGRHLVLEWSEQGVETQVDELREKIKRGYVEKGTEVAGRKRKLQLHDEVIDNNYDD